MTMNKQNITTVFVSIALVIFIAWAFLKNISSTDKQQDYDPKVPQKAVMQQAWEMNEARLEAMARRGQIALGMSKDQARMALGEPSRTLDDSSKSKARAIWWYESRGQKKIVYFGANGRVVEIK